MVQAGPCGRPPDMGGPQVCPSEELARIWLKQRDMHRAILPIFLPGKMVRALRQGGNTCPQQATGTVSWEAWLQQHERDRKSTRLNSSHQIISYAVFCLKKKKPA